MGIQSQATSPSAFRRKSELPSSEKDIFHHGCDLSPIPLRSCCFPTLIFRSSRLLGTSDPSCGLSAGSDHSSGGSRGDEAGERLQKCHKASLPGGGEDGVCAEHREPVLHGD